MSKDLYFDQRVAELSTVSGTTAAPSVASMLVIHTYPAQLTKAAIEGCAERIANIVKEGNASALDVSTRLQWMAGVIEQARKLIQDDCVDEIEKENGKATINGAEVIKKETGVKYQYAACNDPAWNALNLLETNAKEKRGEREKFLKNLTASLTIADNETGEMITLNPPIKSSTTNIQITFK